MTFLTAWRSPFNSSVDPAHLPLKSLISDERTSEPIGEHHMAGHPSSEMSQGLAKDWCGASRDAFVIAEIFLAGVCFNCFLL